ncbi:hypothetical protein VB834_14805 [Limnoraphis robusta Tam1]|uniref:DUF4145 domain-containing protein n=1 Tax=Limnoraphis robusta CCNP1315 TaxID=3110306 RepID=A0ABU5U2I6_9CYAN|nr:hypothetical protein [Limnoraphis robusta]MEA5521369.1 hypothetical protein [Limnoraphis robusta CCNP1315]MEA5540294.1 hypothetical protein [Limnoraphis robusta Tam1]MEA5547954.1 hypothetical protein [Limnoraphis robusta CCNP1324]
MTAKYFSLLDHTIGLYKQAFKILEPGEIDDFTVISGCILLTTGLEKLIKWALYKKNRLMILDEKITFKTLMEFENGSDLSGKSTVSIDKAKDNLFILYKNLNQHEILEDINYLIKTRNALAHNFGYVKVGELEKRIQTKVIKITEIICELCLDTNPKVIFGEELWNQMITTRDAYRKADILELEQRIKHLRRMYQQGLELPCERIELSEKFETTTYPCPICSKNAEVVIDYDLLTDEDIILNVHYYVSLVQCKCGFSISEKTMNGFEEIKILLGKDYEKLIKNAIDKSSE